MYQHNLKKKKKMFLQIICLKRLVILHKSKLPSTLTVKHLAHPQNS